jgi:hypothetical protein
MNVEHNGRLEIACTGRKSFFGSDDHAEAAANLYSLIASWKLHASIPSVTSPR